MYLWELFLVIVFQIPRGVELLMPFRTETNNLILPKELVLKIRQCVQLLKASKEQAPLNIRKIRGSQKKKIINE